MTDPVRSRFTPGTRVRLTAVGRRICQRALDYSVGSYSVPEPKVKEGEVISEALRRAGRAHFGHKDREWFKAHVGGLVGVVIGPTDGMFQVEVRWPGFDDVTTLFTKGLEIVDRPSH